MSLSHFTCSPPKDLIVFGWCNAFAMLFSQQLQSPVGSKMNAFEKRLENVTTALNNLHNSLEEVSTLSRLVHK